MTERFLTRRLLPALGAALLLAGLWSGPALASVRVEAVSQSNIDDMEAQLSDLADEIQALEDQLDEISGQRDQALEELAQAREELAAQGTVIVSEGEWYWPVPGSYTLTSGFGWRIHPIYGTRRYHNGTDIGGSGIGGTEIGAAKSGVVTTSQYSSSYGNYVVVTHADGYQTLYAHMSTRLVSVGDTVTQGQALGLVGSTGLSTGNHLHFEVWYNGTHTDPEQYYPELEDVFYRRYNAA